MTAAQYDLQSTSTNRPRSGSTSVVAPRQLELIGEDPDRDGLIKTPSRVAASLEWLTRGYETNVADVIGDALFEETHESMVMVRDIELYSLCEHHMLPFYGKAHIAYIPNGKNCRPVETAASRRRVRSPAAGSGATDGADCPGAH